MHPSLKASIQQSQYKVHIHDQLITHEVPTDPKSSVSGFWAYLWPNTAINVYGSGMSIERILPIDTDNTQIHYLYLFQPNSSEKEITSTIEMSREVTEEDIKICNAVAHNLRTGMYSKGPLSPKHEHGIWHVHNLIKKALS
jgi:choline monooxygenase